MSKHYEIVSGRTVYFVEVADVSGYINEFHLKRLADEDPKVAAANAEKKRVAEKAECDRRGGVGVGMTRAQVIASCWGKPQRVNKTVTGNGTHEQFVYPNGTYFYLSNGVVTSMQTTE